MAVCKLGVTDFKTSSSSLTDTSHSASFCRRSLPVSLREITFSIKTKKPALPVLLVGELGRDEFVEGSGPSGAVKGWQRVRVADAHRHEQPCTF
jgi:hypothetical protein